MAKSQKQSRRLKGSTSQGIPSSSVKEFLFTPFVLMPFCVIVWGILYGIVGEIINVKYGFGWDGLIYGTLVQKWKYYLEQHSIDSYRVLRIFPSVMLHYLCEPLMKDNLGIIPALTVLKIYRIYTVIILSSAAFAWAAIGATMKWSIRVQWLGFLLLFVNFAVMKFAFYYVPLTDATAFTLALWGLYFYFAAYPVGVLCVGCIGFFAFPTVFLQSALLYCFPYTKQNSRKVLATTNSTLVVIGSTTLVVLCAAAALIYGVFVSPVPFAGTQPLIESLLYPSVTLLVAYWAFMSYVIASWFPFPQILQMVKESALWLRTLTVIGLAALLWFGIAQHLYNPMLPAPLTFSHFIGGSLVQSVSKPLLAPLAFVVYFGPAFVLIALLFRQSMMTVQELGCGFAIIITGTILLIGIMTESRQLITLFPCVVIVLAAMLNRHKLSNTSIFVVALVSLISSKIWFRINFEGMNSNAVADTLKNYDTFPMQNYFMNQGPWMSMESYLYQSIAIIVAVGGLWWVVARPIHQNMRNTMTA
jgi:hypothetical protein